jgi:glycosyltransferase involved in cell wall biosynthesis
MLPMTKILYIGNYLSRANTNKTYMFLLAALLQKEGFDVKCTSAKHNKVFRLLDMIWTLIVHGRSAHHILIDTYSTTNFYYAFIISQLCRLFKFKYSPILHGGNLPKRLESNPKLSKLIFNYSETNVSPSSYLINAFKLKGYTNIEHIPNTIELDLYTFQNRDINTIKLLWVRGFSTIYNPQLAISVLNKLIKKGYKAQLCMVGPDIDGSLGVVKKLAQQKKLEVTFTGKLTKSEWIDLSKNYNVFINTTDIDNTPVSVIEAMALGLPVVSTNVGGLPYLIENQKEGLLVPKQDIEAMVNAIIKLKIDEALKSEIVTNARFKAEKFDWNTIKHRWRTVLS